MSSLKISIGGLKDISTIDYPGEAVSVIFTCGCPFRCLYCQNWSFFDPNNCKDEEINDVVATIERYSKFTTGVAITGGEPTMQAEPLIDLLKKIRKTGKIKLDTNGNYPDVIEEIIKKLYFSGFGLGVGKGGKILENSLHHNWRKN